MASHDASVTALMDRMSVVDKQRRVLNMRQKELEAKVAFATSEKADAERDAKVMDNEEAQLKADLEALTSEEQQLALQRMEVTDRLRRTQEEEVVYTNAATAEHTGLVIEKSSWAARTADLETLRRMWEEDPGMTACIASLRAEMEQLTALRAAKETLQESKTSLEASLEKMRIEQQALLARSTMLDSTGVGAIVPALALLHPTASDPPTAAAAGAHEAREEPAAVDPHRFSAEEELKRSAYEWSQLTTRHASAMTSLQREVNGLGTRAAELQELLTSVQAAEEDIVRRSALLQRCLETSWCTRCDKSSAMCF